MSKTTEITTPRLRHGRDWWRFPEGNPDLLFKEDGSVHLPKLLGLAIRLAAKSHGCLTRQPTRARAEVVMEAMREQVESRGLTMEIRPGKTTDTFGVYVLPNVVTP